MTIELLPDSADVIVAGAGIAGLSAALAARACGANVVVLERAPAAERGGNTRFSNGAMRGVYAGVGDIERWTGPLDAESKARTSFGSYSRQCYLDDMARITGGRTDPQLCADLVDGSAATFDWLARHGVPFAPLYAWQFHAADGRITFQGGSAVEAGGGGGEGLSAALFSAAERSGVRVVYGARAVGLARSAGNVTGIEVEQDRRTVVIGARAVVLACGGFEADAGARVRHLGAGWDAAKVRGSRFNTGDGLRIALDAGAQRAGDWSGCHSASWDANAPDVNELRFGTVFKRDDFMYGLVVNARGERFFDEGADIRAVTYARLGRAILAEPGQIAWQIFDAGGAHLLHAEYRSPHAARTTATSLDELAGKCPGLDRDGLLATVAAFNRAVDTSVPFDAAAKDGRGTRGLAIPKSNWACAIETPPFEAYAVTAGITFTFGGLRIDSEGRVLGDNGAVIGGLYAAGEMVGGLFYDNYPGGSGLMSAAVQGRRAGEAAGRSARTA